MTTKDKPLRAGQALAFEIYLLADREMRAVEKRLRTLLHEALPVGTVIQIEPKLGYPGLAEIVAWSDHNDRVRLKNLRTGKVYSTYLYSVRGRPLGVDWGKAEAIRWGKPGQGWEPLS